MDNGKPVAPEVALPTDAGAMVELLTSRIDYANLQQAIADAQAAASKAWIIYEAAKQRLADHEATEPAPEEHENGLELWAMQRIAMQGALPSYERSYHEAAAEVAAAKRALADALMRAQRQVEAELNELGRQFQVYEFNRLEELRHEIGQVQTRSWPGAERLNQSVRALKEAKRLLRVQ